MRYDPGLVLLSVLLAALGGYLGFALADSFRDAAGFRRRLLLAAASVALALGIWTMHFVGMLAAELPVAVGYAVLPTLLSFLLCVLVVGVSVFFTAGMPPRPMHRALAALTMGLGIATMHYLGMSALRGVFCVDHDPLFVAASVGVGVLVSAGALLPFSRPRRRLALLPSALLFGISVAGLHYTAMAGVRFDFEVLCTAYPGELVIGEQELAIAVALSGFLVAGSFLLYLLPEAPPSAASVLPRLAPHVDAAAAGSSAPAIATTAEPPPPPPLPPPLRVPVQGFEGVRLLAAEEIVCLRAEAHYTRVFDGRREGLCDWSISEAERKLAALGFYRCHRCHLVRLDRIRALRRAGKGATVVLACEPAREVPVSRGRLAELERRLGLRAALAALADGRARLVSVQP